MKKRFIVEGKVQGVYFRKYTHQKANELGLKGFVRNLANGNVEVIAEGTGESFESLHQFLEKGSPLSRVRNILVSDVNDTEIFTSFSIR